MVGAWNGRGRRPLPIVERRAAQEAHSRVEPNATTGMSGVLGLAVVALHAGGKTLGELTDDDITACTEALAAAPSLTTTLRGHNTARLFGPAPRRLSAADLPPPAADRAPARRDHRADAHRRCPASRDPSGRTALSRAGRDNAATEHPDAAGGQPQTSSSRHKVTVGTHARVTW